LHMLSGMSDGGGSRYEVYAYFYDPGLLNASLRLSWTEFDTNQPAKTYSPISNLRLVPNIVK
jgi:hypothetical protein